MNHLPEYAHPGRDLFWEIIIFRFHLKFLECQVSLRYFTMMCTKNDVTLDGLMIMYKKLGMAPSRLNCRFVPETDIIKICQEAIPKRKLPTSSNIQFSGACQLFVSGSRRTPRIWIPPKLSGSKIPREISGEVSEPCTKPPDLSIDDKDTRYIRNIRNETTVLAAVVIISSFLVDIFFETSIGQKSPKGWKSGRSQSHGPAIFLRTPYLATLTWVMFSVAFPAFYHLMPAWISQGTAWPAMGFLISGAVQYFRNLN